MSSGAFPRNVALPKAMPKGDPQGNQYRCLLCLPSRVPGLPSGWQQASQDSTPWRGKGEVCHFNEKNSSSLLAMYLPHRGHRAISDIQFQPGPAGGSKCGCGEETPTPPQTSLSVGLLRPPVEQVLWPLTSSACKLVLCVSGLPASMCLLGLPAIPSIPRLL